MTKMNWERARRDRHGGGEPPGPVLGSWERGTPRPCATCGRPFGPDDKIAQRRTDGASVHSGGCPPKQRAAGS